MNGCACARHDDGSVTTFLCPIHADTDPCLTMSLWSGRRRKGTIRRGVCTSCGHNSRRPSWQVWRAPNVWRDGRRVCDPVPVSDAFSSFDAAADYGAELESVAAARGDVFHLFIREEVTS